MPFIRENSTELIDAVETTIAGFEQALEYLQTKRPKALQELKNLWLEVESYYDLGLLDWSDIAYQAIIICMARVSLRYGLDAEHSLAYHNETHCLDVMRSLTRLLRHTDQSFNDTDKVLPLDATSCMCLMVFAAGHDIRQTIKGNSTEGVGYNEAASAAEVRRILVNLGMAVDAKAPVFELLSWMIDGSTFFTQPFEIANNTWQTGALAPRIATQIGQSQWFGLGLSARQAAELVLLAADIDTANVSLPISEYAIQTIRVCREVYREHEFSLIDPSISQSVLDFLTDKQAQYFFELQVFHSQLAQQVFNGQKLSTGIALKELVQWLEQNYARQKNLPTAESIMQVFVQRAEALQSR